MAGRYKIFEQLGAGGAGTVFKGYDTQLERYVAVKRLISSSDAAKSEEEAALIRKEAGALANLRHPNIVQVFDVSSDDEGLFIVMELLEGDDLGEWLARERLGLTDFNELAAQTLEALIFAHGQNILHRDIKPENIKVARLPGDRFMARIIDFGLARMAYTARKQTVDQSGCVMGSVHYMAPEQLLRQPIDARSDLYALGCVFYQALTGQRPFDSPTVKGVMDGHLKHLVRPLNEVVPDVPQVTSDWVMWLMNLDPNDRPESAQVALEWLKANVLEAGSYSYEFAEAQAAEPEIPVPDQAPEPAWEPVAEIAEPAPAPVRKPAPPVQARPKVPVFLLMICAAVVVGGVWLLLKGGGWITLFNGKDLTGWKGDLELWEVQGGAIVGKANPKHLPRSYLISDAGTFSDFVLEADFALMQQSTNSGITFRAKVIDEAKWLIRGYQAEISGSATGSIYDEGGRGMYFKPLPSHAINIKPNTWNHYRITAQGLHLTLEVNGVVIGDYTEDDQDKKLLDGVIGLESNDSIRFKDIRIKSL